MSSAEMRRMPSTCTASNATGRPNASAARIASLWAASMPSMSKRGVGLGVAELLRLGQHLGELAAALAHHREDVVAGAVEDAGDAGDAVAGQALAQRLDDRDAAGHRRLEGQRHAGALGRRGQLGAVHRQQRLVGGHHRLAGRQRRLDQRPRRPLRRRRSAPPPHRPRVGGQRHRVVVPAQPGQRRRRGRACGRGPRRR